MKLKPVLTAVIAVAVIMIGLLSYASVLLHSITTIAPPKPLGAPSISATLVSKSQLSYNSSRYIVPSVELGYATANVTSLYVNATLFATRPPSQFFILNASSDCFDCAQLQPTINMIGQYLASYGLVRNSSSVHIINEQNLTDMPNSSMLIILNGVLPQYMIQDVQNTSTPLIQYLLERGVDIIYVGRNFANVSSGRILIPTPSSQIPQFLLWGPGSVSDQNIPYYFRSGTFTLLGGKTYGPLSYINLDGNGSLLAFPNYLSSWPNASDAAQDIAKASLQLFWIPIYAQGGRSVILPNSTSYSGKIGVALSSLGPGFDAAEALSTSGSYGRIVVYNNASYSPAAPKAAYALLTYAQSFTAPNGSINLPASILPGAQLPVTITIDTGSSVPVSVAPHITIYNINMTPVQSIALSPFTESGNFTQIETLPFDTPPGEYVAEVQGFYGKLYVAALFSVPPISISLTSANYTAGRFSFSVTSAQAPLTGVNYTININGLYESSGIITNGTIAYALPSGAPQQKGAISFNIGMLSEMFTYSTTNVPPTIRINDQYVELAIVAIFAIVIVLVVKAPNRDEFYIDIPETSERKETPIKIRASELVSVFDKQNIYYRWRYMPLSVEEVKRAIATNVSVNNIAVSLTYSNVEMLLIQLESAGYLISADGLYAPKSWVQQSGHDIEYLSTFKKLRLYFVSHAYQFNDIDSSDSADIVATAHGERSYIVIYSRTSRFQRLPVFHDSKTYLAFLNGDRLDEFLEYLHSSKGPDVEEIKVYLSAGQLTLINSDRPGETLT